MTVKSDRMLHWSIDLGAGFFILALLLSALFDPRIRILHTLQALIYLAVIVLTRRNSSWGFGAGFLIAIFWNYTNLFVTTFVRGGWNQLHLLMTSGHASHPDRIIALIACGGHFLMIAGCLAGILLLRPSAQTWTKFFAGGVIAVASFILMIYTTGPQYIPLMRHVFHLG